jgi:hypothetical protein
VSINSRSLGSPVRDLPDFVLDDAGRTEVIEILLKTLRSVYAFPDVAKDMDRAIRA